MVFSQRAAVFCLLFLLALSSANALAEGTAYLRLINAVSGKPINGIAGDLTFTKVKDFSAYLPVAAGEYNASVHKSKLALELAANTRYSLLYYRKHKKKQLMLLEDSASADTSKAQLRLYNFSDAPARLRATNFNTDLTKDAPPMGSIAEDVDALGLDVAITLDNVDVASFAGVDTEYGKSYSFLLTGVLPKYAATWSIDKVKDQ